MRILLGLIFAFAAFAAGPPQGVSVYTWVREDIFAGYMAGDMDRYRFGVAKVDEILASNPDQPDALVWKGSTQLFDATRAYQQGNATLGASLVEQGRSTMRRARDLAPSSNLGPAITSAATLVLFADKLPHPQRRQALEEGQTLFIQVRGSQAQVFDKLPLHLKGELLAGLAQSAQRLGNNQSAEVFLREITEKMPNTVYASRAQKWLADPNAASNSAMVCMTCHDPGRLKTP